VRQRKVPREFKVKELSKHKRKGLYRERSRAPHREASEKALQDHLLASNKVRESNRGKRSDMV